MKLIKLILPVLLYCLVLSCNKETENNYVPASPVEQARSKKRGVSFSFQLEEDMRLLAPGISWSYNWGLVQSSIFDPVVQVEELDFCPMAWNGINEAQLREYVARHPECEYLLTFNEPNLTDQANMTPARAAAIWPEVRSIAKELGLKLVSPAMNYGTLEGYGDPIDWLDEFFSLVPLSDVDAIAIHCYMASPQAVKWYIERFKKYNKPIWLTEFCAWEGRDESNFSDLDQQRFMCDVINYLEAYPLVERYAWFIPRTGGGNDSFPHISLLRSSSPSQLTELGNIFTRISSQDDEAYYVEQQQIEAENYSSISIADGLGEERWVAGPWLRTTTDAPNESLELYQFLPGQWVEYQLQVDRTRTYDLEVRYATFMDTEITLALDGEPKAEHLLENTKADYIWRTASLPLYLDSGQHVLRISVSSGMACMNWLRFE